MSLHVCYGDFFFDSRLAIFWEETVLLDFCLQFSDCGAVTLNASFFPTDVLERRVLCNCIDF